MPVISTNSLIATVCFCLVMVNASYNDIKQRKVKRSSYIYLILTALIDKDIDITASILGAVIIFIILFVSALISNDLGGGDVKYCALCSFVISSIELSFVAVMLGCILTLITVPIMKKTKHLKAKTIPMIPFFSIGFLTVAIYKLFI